MEKYGIKRKKRYDSLDWFRLVAAALVVAIHTSPLTDFSEDADFFLARVLARIAVPFFFMVTGQFVAAGQLDTGKRRVFQYVKKIAALYGISVLLYLPVGIYAGHYQEVSAADVFRMLVFDGTFYHLWYFPACMAGVLLVYGMGKCLKEKQMLILAAVLYGIGLFGDSYYGLAQQVPVAAGFYEACFSVFSYTRNGIFMAPLFLLLGAQAGKSKLKDTRILWAGLCISFVAMSEEAFLLRYFELQRHDSMYALLPVVMFFLYKILLEMGCGIQKDISTVRKEPGRKRMLSYAVTVSTWIYVLHPAVIVVVRGAAKVLKLEVLTDHSMVHYIVVLLLSAAVSFLFAVILKHCRRGRIGSQRTGSRADGFRQARDRRQDKALGESGMVQEPAAGTGYRCGRAWLELDRSALYHNVVALRERLPDSCRLMPAVKADAYGHSAVLVAKILQDAGVDAFCVACAKEGVQLRKKGIQGMILVLGYTHPQQFALLEKYCLTQTVVDHAYAIQLDAYGRTLHVHIGIDTGMHRLGVRSDRLEQVADIYEMEHLAVDGLYTHLCVSDSMTADGRSYTDAQAQAFYRLVAQLEQRGYPCPCIHMQASYGVLNYPELAGDYARVGIALYGVLSTSEDTAGWQNLLQPVLSMKARVATVKMLYRGESAGYGIRFTAKQDMKIATLTVGYADGLPRTLSEGVGSVLIHGYRAPVIGRVCMDQTTVDVSGIPHVQAGDEAVLIGRCGELEISVCDLAAQAGTITNEILSRMGARLERVVV
ncbi:MAG: serine racemase VanT catalytic subunit [Eubacterium sp.]|nr:serine racemase VanT catalytic subunit [Eubacterium sp.]